MTDYGPSSIRAAGHSVHRWNVEYAGGICVFTDGNGALVGPGRAGFHLRVPCWVEPVPAPTVASESKQFHLSR